MIRAIIRVMVAAAIAGLDLIARAMDRPAEYPPIEDVSLPE